MTALTVALPSRYHGAELIASGGMADVYAATDEMLERRVAIKILSQRFALDPDVRARFAREARIAARLSNEPNIVTIFDVADIQERPAIVMEYLPGGTIADRMRAGFVSPALALAWLAQAGRALDAAHAQGVVHRDVKPANLMLSGDGELRVADFGIARIAGDSSLTSVGTVLGTSGYMSPEQAVGGTATPASDRYALAVVAFELLTGRRPYVAESFVSEAAAHATAPIPAATTVDGSLPAAIDAVFERGLAKAPEDRFRSCGELVASLTGVFSESAGTTVRLLPEDAPIAPARAAAGKVHRSFRRGPLLALGTLAVLGIVAAAFLTRDDSRPGGFITVMRTATVAGKPQVRTVTVEGQPAAAAPQVTSAASPSPAQSSQGGAALNDQGFRLLQRGDAAGALPLLEQAVSKLQGTGSLAEAYASYNLALARYSTGSCDGVQDLLEHSKEIQGDRHEIKDLRHEVDKSCKGHKELESR